MSLNKSKGNMYGFVTHTWNTCKGRCPHDCVYCYMKRFPQPELHFDEKELKTDLGSGNTIFVGSSCDMFADDVLTDWIVETLKHCNKYPLNTYLFQSKNPSAYLITDVIYNLPPKTILCTTIETNREYGLMHCENSMQPIARAHTLARIKAEARKMITIEPIMDFDIVELVRMIGLVKPFQVNIGADSGGNHLPEPTKDQILDLIGVLSKFTTVHRKPNLERLIK